MVKKSRITKSWKLVIPQNLWARLQEHLFPGDDDEHGAVITAGVVQAAGGNRLLARDLFIAKDGEDYVRGEYGYRMLRANFIRDKILYCRDETLAYLAVHCHGGSDWVGFSPTDVASHERGYPALRDIVQGQPVGAIVCTEHAVAGDIWLPDGEKAAITETIVVGTTVQRLYAQPLSLKVHPDETYDRQSRIFGDRGQQLLSKLKVGVIGAGGAGSLIVEHLARLGVGYIVIADHDYIDHTNRPRVVGSTDHDVETETKKVVVAKREAKTANSKIKVDAIVGNIVDNEVAHQFVDCDYLFLAADTMQARLVFNALVHQYLIPGIQVGVKVLIESNTGRITDIFCVSRPVTPDQGCLWCNGLISASQLQEEAIGDEERLAQQYVNDPTVSAPSVITLNAIATAHATNNFLFAVTGMFNKKAVHGYVRWRPQFNEMWFDQPCKGTPCLECSSTPGSRFARGDSWPLPTKIDRSSYMSQQKLRTEIEKKDFVSTGILFLFFATTLFIYGGGKFAFTLFGHSWTGPDWLTNVFNVITYTLSGLSGLTSLVCLFGVFCPTRTNALLMWIRNSKLGTAKSYYYQLYYWAITFSFFISWSLALMGLAMHNTLFYLVFFIGLAWTIALIIAIPSRHQKDP